MAQRRMFPFAGELLLAIEVESVASTALDSCHWCLSERKNSTHNRCQRRIEACIDHFKIPNIIFVQFHRSGIACLVSS